MKLKADLLLLALTLAAASAAGADFTIASISGSALVRHGAQHEWLTLTPGDTLRPEDSIELGKGSWATIELPEGSRVVVPEQVILNLSDIRTLTQEELLLLLAMENIRSISPRERPAEVPSSKITAVHGTQHGSSASRAATQTEEGQAELNGARVLYDHGYFATCILRIKSTLRLHPSLTAAGSMRLLAADAMERMGVLEEALIEYRSMLKDPKLLTEEQRFLAEQQAARLSANQKGN